MGTSRVEKQLVVSGLEEGNLDAEVAVKRWCEVRSKRPIFKWISNLGFHQSFGELRRISRKDGALHVSWKKASVADTVSCDIFFINNVFLLLLTSGLRYADLRRVYLSRASGALDSLG
jgi:hypothetical protein